MSKTSQIKVSNSIEKLKASIQETLETILNATSASNYQINVGLSGGSIINLLTQIFANLNLDLKRLVFYFCDERIVNQTDPNSTYGAYKKYFIQNNVAINFDQIIKINENLDSAACAEDYARKIKQNVRNISNGIPEFDILFLGIGHDGHTCSLFPNHDALNHNDKLVTCIENSPKPPPRRITFTYKLLNNARNALFIVTGKAKQTVIKEIFTEGKDYPASRVKSKNVIWFLDQEASALLPSQFTN